MPVDVIIRKQKIKVVTTDEQYAFAIRKRLNDQLQYDLIKVLEQVFSKITFSDDYITIDKLQIDVGTLTPDLFEQHFVELIRPKLETELQKLVEAAGGAFGRDKQQTNKEPNAAVSATSKKAQQTNALLYFLEWGSFPWWYKKEQQQTPAALLGNLSQEEIERLLSTIVSIQKNGAVTIAKKITDRLFIYLPESKMESLIYQLSNLYNNNLLADNVDVLVNNKEALTQSLSITEKAFYKTVFKLLIEERIEKDVNIVDRFINRLDEHQHSIADKLASKETTDVNKKKPTITPPDIEQEGIYISNAGLVLLHPFLPSFFQHLNLLNAQHQFISVHAQQKAAVMLYYLQCSNEHYQEWEMAFNKILCGIAVDDVLPEGIEIAANEREQSKSLLQSMVNYWEALKGASVEAVQNSFILREGKVTRKDDHWLLQVERSGVDILLEKLPWSFSTIKLPWLNHLIYTEW